MSETNRYYTALPDDTLLKLIYPDLKVNLRAVLHALRDILMFKTIWMTARIINRRNCNVIVPSLRRNVKMKMMPEYIMVEVDKKEFHVPYTLDDKGIISEETMDIIFRLLLYLKVDKVLKSWPSSKPFDTCHLRILA